MSSRSKNRPLHCALNVDFSKVNGRPLHMVYKDRIPTSLVIRTSFVAFYFASLLCIAYFTSLIKLFTSSRRTGLCDIALRLGFSISTKWKKSGHYSSTFNEGRALVTFVSKSRSVSRSSITQLTQQPASDSSARRSTRYD